MVLVVVATMVSFVWALWKRRCVLYCGRVLCLVDSIDAFSVYFCQEKARSHRLFAT